MIFDRHGKTLLGGIQRRTFRDRPGFEDALHLETEVVVEAGGAVLLHHEAVSFVFLHFGGRLGGVGKAAFALIFLKCHSGSLDDATHRSRCQRLCEGRRGLLN